MTRREFLQCAGAGLTLAVVFSPFGLRAVADAAATEFQPNAWLTVHPDGSVTIVVAKSEMGQGVYTSMAMIVADELDADWKRVAIEVAPARDEYKDLQFGMQATGGSTSVRHMYEPLRKAGAAARQMLVAAAAQRWGVPARECATAAGVVTHAPSGRSAGYGELCAEAAAILVPADPPLKKKGEMRLVGTPLARVDSAAKVNGAAVFGLDVRVPGMRYAVLARPPAFGAKVVSADRAAALQVPGVEGVLPIDRGVAVWARTLEAAWKGRDALAVQWDKGVEPGLGDASLRETFAAHLGKDGLVARTEGDARAALAGAAKRVEARYFLPYLAHATMEPMNATAAVTPERCELWLPTQNQTGALGLAAKISGLPPDRITVNTTFLGGGFGRRFEMDLVEEALLVAKAAGVPVKVVWTREEDLRYDYYRPGNAALLEGGLDGEGRLVAWRQKVAVPPIFDRVFPGMIKDGIDLAAIDGFRELEYEIPNVAMEYVRVETPVPVGFWRSVGNSHNAFTIESFVDELARAAGKDPLAFRLALLQNHPRAARVIRLAAEKAGWGAPLPAGRALGLAYCHSFDSRVAEVAEVSLNASTGDIVVHRAVCAVDCGVVVNPDTVRAQIMGGCLMGLSAALKEAVAFGDGGARSSNFGDYRILRNSEAPAVEVHIVDSDEKPGGIGEPGVPPIAPAVANAFFALTGTRLRDLPLRPAAARG
jgi:isoquinoline 1-oxidoreductase beta subunit